MIERIRVAVGHKLGFAVLSTTFAVCQLGCSTAPHPADATAKANPTWVPIDEAVHRLAAERCNRETSCTGEGGEHKYADGDACMHEIYQSTKAEYGSTPCSLAIENRRLEDCIDAVHEKGCSNKLEKITRIPSCRAENLCVQLSRGSMGG
ncbi:DUF6184 family natural product biosynthesis lipoprotein [Pendulispora brunnea]|uniref:DUF6184 family natural product biosynthesis lipoprotein n=1 Tax=Pendulispora brunnea TaxID=2905690 RepID=A0ABZ2JVH7_9BACT